MQDAEQLAVGGMELGQRAVVAGRGHLERLDPPP
jgi:hypothetical protein